MSDEFQCYEFGVQIWFEAGLWHWGIAQEWETDGDSEVEAFAYGTAETLEEAVASVAEEMKQIKFEV